VWCKPLAAGEEMLLAFDVQSILQKAALHSLVSATALSSVAPWLFDVDCKKSEPVACPKLNHYTGRIYSPL
jgi:hypothetical protein